jgi:hypothetical protein
MAKAMLLADIRGPIGPKGDKGEVGSVNPIIDRRIEAMEEVASEPGTRLENMVMDPKPATTIGTWNSGNITLIQAPGYGRAIAAGGVGVSIFSKPSSESGEGAMARVIPGENVAARLDIRAMPTQRMSATLSIRGFAWNGNAFSFVTTLATSGQLHIDPDAVLPFHASGVVPEDGSVTHYDLFFTFRRYAETYPSAGDFVYFRKAALYSGPNAIAPAEYIDGDTGNAYWVGGRNASASIRLVPRTGGGNTSAGTAALAHAVRLDDFTYRRGGVKKIGPKTSISFRIDHGLANFNSKMRPKLETLDFKYALALGSRDWGHSENAGITPAIVNAWIQDGLAEVWSHGPSHADADTEAKLQDYIVNSKTELEAALPSAVIDGFMHPGAGGTGYMGFRPSDTPEKFFNTLAGQLILQTYAIGSGEMTGTAYRVQDGRPRVGQAYFNMDTFNAAGVMSRVSNAITDGRGIQLMIHPSLIDTGGITTADLHSVLDQIKALQDAGTVVVMSAYDQMLADSSV